MIRWLSRALVRSCLVAGFAADLLNAGLDAQDRLKSMPGYARYERMSREIPSAVKSGALAVAWTGPNTFDYTRDGKRYRYDVTTRTVTETAAASSENLSGREARGGPARGRQVDSSVSPDGRLTASYHDRNLWLSELAGGTETAITSDGSEKARIKYGTASWVYGEELSQTTAMWWSPDSSKIAYYRFDEQKVPDYFLQTDQTKIQSTIDTEAYPKAGAPNPVVDLFVYDVVSKKTNGDRMMEFFIENLITNPAPAISTF